MAFAQRWHLDMPYFMGFYAEGEDFYNGIHELPITSYGTRLSPYVLGWPASYGCIILNVGDAEALYNWADLGTLVRVNGVAPGTPFGQQTLEDIAPHRSARPLIPTTPDCRQAQHHPAERLWAGSRDPAHSMSKLKSPAGRAQLAMIARCHPPQDRQPPCHRG